MKNLSEARKEFETNEKEEKKIVEAKKLEEAKKNEGKPTKGTHTDMGKKWDTLIFTSIDSANDYMDKNKGYSVIASLKKDKEIHLAKSDDKGTKVNEDFDVEKGIQDLINTNFSASDDEKGKASSLIKGLFFSDDAKAIDLIKKMDKWFSSLK